MKKLLIITLLLAFLVSSLASCEQVLEIINKKEDNDTRSDTVVDDTLPEDSLDEDDNVEDGKDDKEENSEEDNKEDDKEDEPPVVVPESFDYLEVDLTEYISVPQSLYKGYGVKIDIPEITDSDVEEEVIKILCDHKIIPDGPIYSSQDVTISAGDVASIYYRGYTVEDGVKKYFDGGCNFGESKLKNLELEIGSGTFVPGFESGLIGKNGKDYATLTRKENGTVSPGDIITLTYSVTRADGTAAYNKTVVLDLADPTLDEKWGDGFTDFIIGKTVGVKLGSDGGEWLIVDTVVDGATGQDVYTNMLVSTACRVSEGEKLVVKTCFPDDHGVIDLAGKTVYFEVYIVDVKDYATPDFDETFITETLRVSAEFLAEYNGETLVDKYRSYIKSEFNADRDARVREIVENTFWETAVDGAEYKKMPSNEVQAVYNSYLEEIESLYYDGYQYYYPSFDSFVRAYLEISTTADWKSELFSWSEDVVKQKLVFYYIVRAEELVPNDEEYNAVYDIIFSELLDECVKYYGFDINNAEQMETAYKIVQDVYSEKEWRELVIYEHAIEAIISWAVITA